eukprot:3941976-Rhodomonas_salina.7
MDCHCVLELEAPRAGLRRHAVLHGPVEEVRVAEHDERHQRAFDRVRVDPHRRFCVQHAARKRASCGGLAEDAEARELGPEARAPDHDHGPRNVLEVCLGRDPVAEDVDSAAHNGDRSVERRLGDVGCERLRAARSLHRLTVLRLHDHRDEDVVREVRRRRRDPVEAERDVEGDEGVGDAGGVQAHRALGPAVLPDEPVQLVLLRLEREELAGGKAGLALGWQLARVVGARVDHVGVVGKRALPHPHRVERDQRELLRLVLHLVLRPKRERDLDIVRDYRAVCAHDRRVRELVGVVSVFLQHLHQAQVHVLQKRVVVGPVRRDAHERRLLQVDLHLLREHVDHIRLGRLELGQANERPHRVLHTNRPSQHRGLLPELNLVHVEPRLEHPDIRVDSAARLHIAQRHAWKVPGQCRVWHAPAVDAVILRVARQLHDRRGVDLAGTAGQEVSVGLGSRAPGEVGGCAVVTDKGGDAARRDGVLRVAEQGVRVVVGAPAREVDGLVGGREDLLVPGRVRDVEDPAARAQTVGLEEHVIDLKASGADAALVSGRPEHPRVDARAPDQLVVLHRLVVVQDALVDQHAKHRRVIFHHDRPDQLIRSLGLRLRLEQRVHRHVVLERVGVLVHVVVHRGQEVIRHHALKFRAVAQPVQEPRKLRAEVIVHIIQPLLEPGRRAEEAAIGRSPAPSQQVIGRDPIN